MKKKHSKNIKAKKRELKLSYSKKDIFQFLKTNTALSILIALIILFIAIGNAFVVGALIGGYLGAKKAEKLGASPSNFAMIFRTSVGAVIGGITLVLAVTIGSVFHTIGSILGAIVGCVAIVTFSADLTEKVTHKLMHLSYWDNKSTKTTSKK